MLRPRQVARGVESFAARTPTLPPATHTNSYALGSGEVLLVEPATPYEDEQKEWIAWARGLASRGRTPVALFLTHHHPDHVGGARAIASALELPIWAHEATAERLGDLPIARRIADGEEIALDGPVPQRWRAMHTPGHAPGHLCLFDPDARSVVVGDMVASVGTILIEPNDGDMTAYLAQLERLAELDARVALPAHGDPIDAPAGLFRHYVAHRLAREAKILAALDARPGASAALLVPAAYDDAPKAVWPIAALSVEAHLVKLERDGRVARDGSGGWTKRPG